MVNGNGKKGFIARAFEKSRQGVIESRKQSKLDREAIARGKAKGRELRRKDLEKRTIARTRKGDFGFRKLSLVKKQVGRVGTPTRRFARRQAILRNQEVISMPKKARQRQKVIPKRSTITSSELARQRLPDSF